MVCAKKIVANCSDEFYPNDRTCKECRKTLVRKNREKNAEYYREYDRRRFQENPKRRDANARYQKTPAGKRAANKAKRKWAGKSPIKKGAAIMVNNAVRDGRLHKPDQCSECGQKNHRIHGHHDDYAFPLVVRWLCPQCHDDWHKLNGEGMNGF